MRVNRDLRRFGPSLSLQILPQSPDLERFPRFSRARAAECEVKEGDLVYIPGYWFRQFVHEEDFVTVQFASPFQGDRHYV